MSDAVTDTTIISNTTDFLVDTLTTDITDPATAREANSKFVVVKHSGVPLHYPCIVIDVLSVSAGSALGFGMESHLYEVTCEIQIYVKKRRFEVDRIADLVLNSIRTSHQGTNSAVEKGIYNPIVLSSTMLVEDEDFKTGGFEKVFRRIIQVRYQYVTKGA